VKRNTFLPCRKSNSVSLVASGIVTVLAELSWLLEGHEDHEQVTQDGLHLDRDLKLEILE
jgi:hypothetical protein